MIRNLGKALTILAKAEAVEMDYHADVDAWGAPSECHGLVSRGEAQRARLARKHAEAVARRPLRIINREAKKRGRVFLHSQGNCPRWNRALSACVQHPYLTGRL